MSKADKESIQVVVRCRPLNRKEKDENRSSIIDVDVAARQVAIKNPDFPAEAPKSFTFDGTYDENTQQKLFYEESCFGIIESSLEGFNSTIFAYGQTGCGKSYTMQGYTDNDESRGVIPNAFAHIFQCINASTDVEFLIRCSYLELYNEEIRDLLASSKNPGKCELKEDANKGIYVKGLSDVVVESEADMARMLEKGLQSRSTASTLMNAESSRSHSIFTITIEMSTKDKDTGKEMLRVGKINLVDLAGSERQKKTGATDSTLKEGIKINLSLSALGNVISALSEGSKHIPYRDSKLTRLLQDSLGGNSKTMMIAAISPADYNYDETMSTLRYANRAKNIKNKPKINEDPKDAIIREFKEEIERLRQMLKERDGLGLGDAAMVLTHHVAPIADNSSKGALAASSSVSATASSESKETIRSPPKASAKAFAKQSMDSARTEAETVDNTPANSVDEFSPSHRAAVPQAKATRQSKPIAERNEDNTEEEQYFEDERNDVHAMLLAKENEVERERRMREELTERLRQLEHMLVTNHTASDEVEDGIMPTKSEKQPTIAPKQLSKEEEEAQRRYKERRLKAKTKRDERQQRELQQALDERNSMEEELEDLRQTAISVAPSSANSANVDEGPVMKKLTKMKKKYEKKLQTCKEEMEDMREDFQYQRKMLLDSFVEQEKDSKLYEQICRSLLTEKDLRKLIEKCRYDEERDEWITPLAKKKNIDASLEAQPKSSNGSILPDIHQSSQYNKATLGLDTVNNKQPNSARVESSLPHMKGYISSSNNSSPRNKSHELVPLLTLPGGLVSSTLIVASPRTDAGQNGDMSSRSADVMSGDEGGIAMHEKKKKSKAKKPTKAPDQMSQAQVLPSSIPKLPGTGRRSADNSAGAKKNTGRSGNPTGGSSHGVGPSAVTTEEGTGQSAGPIDDWGFQLSKSKGNGPEKEYSDDEDFEPTDEIIASSGYKKDGTGPYPPAYGSKPSSHGGRKKKKKHQSVDYSNSPEHSSNSPGVQENKGISPRASNSTHLPKI